MSIGLFSIGSRNGDSVSISVSVSRIASFRYTSRIGPSSYTPETGSPADTRGCFSPIAAKCPPADQPDSTTLPVIPCSAPCAASQSSAAWISATISVSVASGVSV